MHRRTLLEIFEGDLGVTDSPEVRYYRERRGQPFAIRRLSLRRGSHKREAGLMSEDMKVYKCRKIVKGIGCGEAFRLDRRDVLLPHRSRRLGRS